MTIFKGILNDLEQENRLRRIPPHRKSGGFIDLTSNDYMGLAARAHEWQEEFRNRFGEVSMTSSASRLLASDQEIYNQLEEYLERLYGKPCILFNSGYHANVGILQALSLPDTLIVSDKLIHASAIDGIRLGKAPFRRFNHNDCTLLRKIVEEEHEHYDRIIIVCESVYSMDGDIAPVIEIAEIKKEYGNVMLYIDEAHAIGSIGPAGSGLAASAGIIETADIIIGTFGKACASQGAFAVVSEELKSFLVNTARSLIFSTAIPPVNAAWTLLMLEKLAVMDKERQHLTKISSMFREGIEEITGMPNVSQSAIVPLLTGTAGRAISLSYALEKEGVLALPIRRPTVPPGGERIRFSLTAGMEEDQLKHVLNLIGRYY